MDNIKLDVNYHERRRGSESQTEYDLIEKKVKAKKKILSLDCLV